MLYLPLPIALAGVLFLALASCTHAQATTEHILPLCASETAGAQFPLPLLGSDPKMVKLREQIQRVGKTNVPVLILGETGTGKEVVAQAIQHLSDRRDKPFIARNVTTIPLTLAESELFGHAPGAFTDARRYKAGIFEQADGGTVFLDEIGDMHLSLQAKVLRTIENKEVDVVGGTTKKVDFRLIAATNAALEDRVRAKTFREDLFYRLYVVVLQIPPLRERRADIMLLARHFSEQEAKKAGLAQPKTFSQGTMTIFLHYRWPGNVRELKYAIEGAYALSGDSSEIQEKHLPDRITLGRTATVDLSAESTVPLAKPAPLAEVEKAHILHVLKYTNGNQTEAAEILGISRATLRRHLSAWEK